MKYGTLFKKCFTIYRDIKSNTHLKRIAYPTTIILIITTLVLTLVNFPAIPHIADPRFVMRDYFLWDKQGLEMMKNISNIVPNDATLVVSNYRPVFEYGTGLHTFMPDNISSAEAIHDFVINKSSKYLVEVEHDWDPDIIWGPNGLKPISKYFDEVASFKTDFFKIHLFKDKIGGIINGT